MQVFIVGLHFWRKKNRKAIPCCGSNVALCTANEKLLSQKGDPHNFKKRCKGNLNSKNDSNT